MAKQKKSSSLFSKFIVSIVIALNVAFTIAVLTVFIKTSTEPSSLVVAWFSFTTVELWSLAGIKKAKARKDDNNYDC